MKITKKKNGTYSARASMRICGEEVKKTFTGNTPTEVRRKAAYWAAMNRRETEERMTGAEAVRAYIKAKAATLSPSTARAYDGIYRNHLKAVDLPLDRISNAYVQKLVSDLAKDHSPKTVRNVYGLMTAAVSFYWPEAPGWRVKLPQKVKAEYFCPDDQLMKEVFRLVAGTDMEIPVLLASSIPARRGEICALESGDVKGREVTIRKALVYDHGEWAVKPPKTHAGFRTVTIPEPVASKISGVEGRITEYIPDYLSHDFTRKVVKKLGCPRFTFHSLRHYGASVMLSMGIPLKEVQRRGGWDSAEVLQNIYAHALRDQTAVADARISEHFGVLLG